MISFSTLLLASGLFSSSILASPTPVDAGTAVNDLLGVSIIDDILSELSSIPSGVAADASEASQVFSAFLTAIEDTVASQVTAIPTNIPEVTSVLASVFSATPTNLFDNALDLIANGITPSTDELEILIVGPIAPENSVNNVNTREPATTIYPKKDCNDAPYSLTEAQLRAAIYIPSTFTYGQKPPVILVPGTGTTGYQTFDGNYIPLLQDKPYADLVWLNIPIQLLGDTQVNSEYVAYAINYINGITCRNATLITWSQGGLDSQWAFKYWPSTRKATTQLIAQSPDFHGTVLAYIFCPSFPTLPCPPSIIQQEYNSNFVTTLRLDDGDSAYVPTTTIFSSTDEIVQPQSPVTGASAYLSDVRNVGVTNNQVQAICGGRPAGTFYTHEGVLYNPLGYALTVDALINGRPGQVSNLDLDTVCNEIISPGLDLVDVLITEESILIALVSIILYPFKVLVEPAIMSYAASPSASSVCSSTASTTISNCPASSTVSPSVSSTVSTSVSTTISTRTVSTSSLTSTASISSCPPSTATSVSTASNMVTRPSTIASGSTVSLKLTWTTSLSGSTISIAKPNSSAGGWGEGGCKGKCCGGGCDQEQGSPQEQGHSLSWPYEQGPSYTTIWAPSQATAWPQEHGGQSYSQSWTLEQPSYTESWSPEQPTQTPSWSPEQGSSEVHISHGSCQVRKVKKTIVKEIRR